MNTDEQRMFELGMELADTLREQMGRATLKFPVEAGAAVRRQVRQAIEAYCWKHDLKCDVIEQKGFLESTFLFTITGPHEKIVIAKDDLEAWVKEMS